MLFKTASIGQQYPRLHLELRRVLTELETHLKIQEQQEPVITGAFRTPAEQEEIYWKLLSVAKDGKRLPEKEARMLARHKFTYHFVYAAVDVRVSDPDGALRWLQGYLWHSRPNWELLVHDVVGRHLHVGLKDLEARKKYEQADIA